MENNVGIKRISNASRVLVQFWNLGELEKMFEFFKTKCQAHSQGWANPPCRKILFNFLGFLKKSLNLSNKILPLKKIPVKSLQSA